MSAGAAGAYLWFLRESRSLSRNDVAAAIRSQTGEGTTDVQVMRIEKGQDTKATVIAAFTAVVQGNPAHVNDLLANRGGNY